MVQLLYPQDTRFGGPQGWYGRVDEINRCVSQKSNPANT
jgi:hypothetical protein